jgi:hypothetical protein
LEGLDWLADAPRKTQIVIGENGFPVRFVVPDPRVFALHKIWLSLQPTRDPMKRNRDFRQGEAVAVLVMEYLHLSFDDAALNELPAASLSQRTGLLERLQSRQPSVGGDEKPALSARV